MVVFFFCWFFQTSSWVCVIAYTIHFTFPENKLIADEYINDEGDKVTIRTSLGKFCFAYLFIGPISYLIYIILEFTSVTYEYLKDFNPNPTIKSAMDHWIKLKPDISVEWDCYHYEKIRYTDTDSEGRKHRRTETEKISEDHGTYKFDIYSCRDISGKFTLETNSCLNSYVLVHLSSSVKFADKETVSDFNKELERIRSFSKKDKNFDLKEEKKLNFLSKNQMLLTNKCCCCFINECVFVLFTIICLVEFYKIFFYFMGSEKDFTVKKAVSTRKDLSDNEYNDKYDKENPSIESAFGNTFYEPQDFIQNFLEYKMKNTNNTNNNNLISFEISDEPKQKKISQDDNETPLLYEGLELLNLS